MFTIIIGACAVVVLGYCGYRCNFGSYFGMPRRPR